MLAKLFARTEGHEEAERAAFEAWVARNKLSEAGLAKLTYKRRYGGLAIGLVGLGAAVGAFGFAGGIMLTQQTVPVVDAMVFNEMSPEAQALFPEGLPPVIPAWIYTWFAALIAKAGLGMLPMVGLLSLWFDRELWQLQNRRRTPIIRHSLRLLKRFLDERRGKTSAASPAEGA